MKKRTKLTDEELAVGMWKHVLSFAENWKGSREDAPAIAKLKLDYLLSHGKEYDYWENDCYLCNKYLKDGYKCSGKCPLREGKKCCGVASSWWKACDYAIPDCRDMAIEAIKKILSVMEKECARDERKVCKEGK